MFPALNISSSILLLFIYYVIHLVVFFHICKKMLCTCLSPFLFPTYSLNRKPLFEIDCFLHIRLNTQLSDRLLFIPSLRQSGATMESADFFRQILFQPRLLRIRARKTSPVKDNNFYPIHLQILHIQIPNSYQTSSYHADSSTCTCLIFGFCASDRDFASGFLRIPLTVDTLALG